jgi:DNA-directed RNA polymerase subunit E'/Rpb7
MADSKLGETAIIARLITLPMTAVDKDLDSTIERVVKTKYEGKCIAEGYVMSDSVRVSARDAGRIDGHHVHFKLAISCDICLPTEGMIVSCIAKTVTTTAGVRAEIATDPSPLVIYLARDHHQQREDYNDIKVGDQLKVKVIGQRFEMNDPYISVIGQLLDI